MARGSPRAQPERGAMPEYLKVIRNHNIPYVPPATTKRFIVLSLTFLYTIERSIILLFLFIQPNNLSLDPTAQKHAQFLFFPFVRCAKTNDFWLLGFITSCKAVWMSYVKYLFETFKSVTLCFKEGSGSVLLMGATNYFKAIDIEAPKTRDNGRGNDFWKNVWYHGYTT